MDFKKTIITPQTAFPMKAGLPAREPGMLKAWEELDLYNALMEKNKDLPPSSCMTALPSPTATSTWATL